MQRLGIFGGTFDPFHNAHRAMVQAALASGQVDRLFVIPAGSPPHKLDERVMPAVFRYEMARKAMRDIARAEVLDLEILRSGRSYTMETVEMIREQVGGETRINLIYGSDILQDIEQWHRPVELMKACRLLLAYRGGGDRTYEMQQAEVLRKRYGAQIQFFPAPELTLSSTMVRQELTRQGDWQEMVPPAVAAVIRDSDMYRFANDLKQLEIEQWRQICDLERLLWPVLTKKRLMHSVNVMLYAVHLAKVHAGDPFQAAKAAMLHDCAKCLGHHELMDFAKRAGDTQLMEDQLAHGPAGAVMAQELFDIEDRQILDSIHFHTTGRGSMTKLDKIIYLADKIEYSRLYKDLEPIRRAAETDLDQAMSICLNEVERYLRRCDLPTHPYSVDAIRQVGSFEPASAETSGCQSD